ncbi:MAG: hypothetical protein ACLQPV_12090 [Vulcanimicrobiaceae bacterium]
MRNRISRPAVAALSAALFAGFGTWHPASADVPTVAQLDANARAAGNRRPIAVRVGQTVFATKWPAQILQVAADGLDNHVVLGIRISGVHFHSELTREQFLDEVEAIAKEAFAAEPSAEELDVWTVVPIDAGKGAIVSGDLAKPTSRTVYSASVLRSEASGSALRGALDGKNAFWDEDWARASFKQSGNVP